MDTVCDKVQMQFYRSGDGAAKLLPVAVEEWEARAKAVLGAGPFGYVSGGAGRGDTMRANLEAFYRWRIRPRVCCDISKRDLTCQLFGTQLPAPFLLAPVGVLSIVHPDAELAPARACAESGIGYVLSNVSTTPLEEVAKAAGGAPKWFQLYPPSDRDLTRSFLERAERAGFGAVVVTVDSTLLGWREQDLRNGYLPFFRGHGMGNYFSDPVFRSKLAQPPEADQQAAVEKALREGNNTCFTWAELDFIREHCKLPLLLKGVTHPEDARTAMQHGVDGIIVSNHGGRQLDGAIGTLEALPMVVDAVGGRVPVLLDSGIRRGADVFKALALGATAVLIGRPYVYALAVAGQQGVRAVIDNLMAQFELQVGIAGCACIKDISPAMIFKPDCSG